MAAPFQLQPALCLLDDAGRWLKQFQDKETNNEKTQYEKNLGSGCFGNATIYGDGTKKRKTQYIGYLGRRYWMV